MALNFTIDPALVREAVSRHGGRGRVALVLPADASMRGAALLAAMPGDARTLWWQPDRQLLVVGSGVAGRIKSPAAAGATEVERFGSVPFADFAASVTVVDPYDTGLIPRLVGGFSFFEDDIWESFGPGELILPEVSYVREGSTAAWIVVPRAAGGTGAMEVIEEIIEVVQPLAAAPPPRFPVGVGEDPETLALVESAVDAVRGTALEKVVVARVASVDGTVDVPILVDTLAATYAECATFAFERAGEWFVGATPELLVRKEGDRVVSAALAATAPRHDDPVLDRIELESLQSSKQLEEHRLVVDAVVDALEGLGIATTVHAQQVMELRRVRHLLTAVEGPAPDDIGLLEVVGALHPTPAVGGVPGTGALEWIRSNEGFTRGWYAGPVGAVDLAGNGEFRVALRSARVTPSAIHLYAGAGIVAESDPQAEVDEIALKLGVMAGAVEAAR